MRVDVVASYRRYRSSHWLYDNPQRFEDQNILNVPNAMAYFINLFAFMESADYILRSLVCTLQFSETPLNFCIALVGSQFYDMLLFALGLGSYQSRFPTSR